jgi:beta-glucosidase
VSDLIGRMSVQDKMAQLIQGDMTNYLNLTDGTVNKTGLAWNMQNRANSLWTGLYTNLTTVIQAGRLAQDYMLKETELGEFTNHLPWLTGPTNH